MSGKLIAFAVLEEIVPERTFIKFRISLQEELDNYLNKTLKFLNDYKIADTRKQPCPS